MSGLRLSALHEDSKVGAVLGSDVDIGLGRVEVGHDGLLLLIQVVGAKVALAGDSYLVQVGLPSAYSSAK